MIAVSASVIASHAVLAQDAQVKRGQYLVTLGGCTDCHTPGYFFGKPDMARFLGGSEVGFEIPALGVFHGPNLTPDRDTGIGWLPDETGFFFNRLDAGVEDLGQLRQRVDLDLDGEPGEHRADLLEGGGHAPGEAWLS